MKRYVAWTLALVLLVGAGSMGLKVLTDARGARGTAPEAGMPMSQDYRASLLALQTGWMSFGQLRFAAGR
ncbi:MAG TPA: hypothetical protein VLI46_07325 [Ramlibacter sp.]|nr:hypothetical protein [Ramlibacter sp.]